MEDMNVVAYICGKQLKGIEVGNSPITHTGPNSITEENGNVEVPLLPLAVDVNNYYIDVLIHHIYSSDARFCRLSNALGWTYQQRETVHVEGSTYETLGINVQYVNPDICDWEKTELSGMLIGPLKIDWPGTGDGSCPEDKKDVLKNEGIKVYNTASLVPGEALYLYWKFLGRDTQLIQTVYVYSTLLTGGIITKINKPSEFSYNVTYDIAVEGSIWFAVDASDLYEYAVGDWVFVSKKGDAKIIPMHVNGTTGGGIGP